MIEPDNAVGLIPPFCGTRESAQVTNWMKDLRAELAQNICEKSIYPKNQHSVSAAPNCANRQ